MIQTEAVDNDDDVDGDLAQGQIEASHKAAEELQYREAVKAAQEAGVDIDVS